MTDKTIKFINKAKEIHGNIYDYSKVEYKKSIEKVIIICKEHGEFLQTPHNHLIGRQCSKCSGGIKYTLNDFIEKANSIYNNKYDYSKVNYYNSYTKIIIICKKHGEFIQNPTNHLKGIECLNCVKGNQYSKLSLFYLNFISKLYGINIQHSENIGEFLIPTTNYKADGYCKETNTIYEFNGDYWHGNPKIYKHDKYNKTINCKFSDLYNKTIKKEQKIKDLGYNLVIMWEYDWIKLNKCIKIIQQKFRNSKVH
jgi:hypothetical protein